MREGGEGVLFYQLPIDVLLEDSSCALVSFILLDCQRTLPCATVHLFYDVASERTLFKNASVRRIGERFRERGNAIDGRVGAGHIVRKKSYRIKVGKAFLATIRIT